jgi:ComF family protein
MGTLQALCGRCLAEPPAFDASFAATSYTAPMDQLVQALKFGRQLPYATVFAQLILQVVSTEAIADAGLVLAVPLSVERLAVRGFNQAHEIARPLARAWQLPLATDVCLRVRDTEPQSALAPDRRRDNMHGAFTVARREAIAGKHVIVVDDVMTTGHTLDALAACLKRHGATRVTNIVFARTPLR